MLNFDEFQAMQRRENNARQSEQQTKPTASSSSSSSSSSSKAAKASNKIKTEDGMPGVGGKDKKKSFISSAFGAMGEFLEMQQLQALYVVLLLLDTFAALADGWLSNPKFLNVYFPGLHGEVMRETFRAITSFTSIFFVSEIVAVSVVFGFSLFGHWGYTIDFFFIFAQLYLEAARGQKLARLLNIFRFWRLLRLFNSMVGVEKEAHENTRERLDVAEMETKKLKMEIAGLRDEVNKEREARGSVEDMLAGYRDEVDTLNEALKIAAMDIAEVAQADDDLFDDDDLLDEDAELDDEMMSKLSKTLTMESSLKTGSAASELDTEDEYVNKGKTAIMRAVLSDRMQQSGSGAEQSTTFLVREDGTFENK